MNLFRIGAIALLTVASIPADAKPKKNPVTDGFAGLECHLDGGAAKLTRTADDPAGVIADLKDGTLVEVIDGVVIGGRPQVWPAKQDDEQYVRFKVKADGKTGWMPPKFVTCG